MRKLINLFLITVITAVIVIVSCADKEDNNLSQTGLLDANGNIIQGTLIETNVVWVTNNIDVWITKGGVHKIISNRDGSVKVEYTTNVLSPNLPEKPTDLYRIRVPFARKGDGYHTVNYRDTAKLNQLWLDQINRRGVDDGKVFAIRNRANNRSAHNFQNPHNGRQDYYYFADNGDIYYKGGDKNNKTGETLMKRFVGAIIVDYRKVTRRWNQSKINADDVIYKTGEWTVGAIYKMGLGVFQAEEKFAGDDATDGAYEFIIARRMQWLFNNGIVHTTQVFKRQFYTPNFIEVLVLNPHTRVWDKHGDENTLGVDAYYAYYGYGSGTVAGGGMPGFQEWNMPYMQNENIYLAQRPEYTVPLLTHTTTFTDETRSWCFLAMPGFRY